MSLVATRMAVGSRLAMSCASAHDLRREQQQLQEQAQKQTTPAFVRPPREPTLGDLMRSAVGKSRRLSSPKSKAPLRDVVLQNRMVVVVNGALARNPLYLSVSSLDVAFINAGAAQEKQQLQQEAAMRAQMQVQQQQAVAPMETEDSEEDMFGLTEQPSEVAGEGRYAYMRDAHLFAASAESGSSQPAEPAQLDAMPADVAEEVDARDAARTQQRFAFGSFGLSSTATATATAIQQQQQQQQQQDEEDAGSSSGSSSCSGSSSSGSSDEEDEGRASTRRARQATRAVARRARRHSEIPRRAGASSSAAPLRAQSCPLSMETGGAVASDAAAISSSSSSSSSSPSPFQWRSMVDAGLFQSVNA